MFIEGARYRERFGSVRMSHVPRVISLDSGMKRRPRSHGTIGVRQIDEEMIRHFEDRMAIVIPTKDEKLRLLDGVISGVPHDCLVIVVSNSQRERVDRFRMVGDIIDQLCRFTLRQALIIHQKDPAVAKAALEADYNDLLDQDGLVRNGKGEAMIIGLLIAKAAGKEYVGFIDADNYFPGSVLEYVRNYARKLLGWDDKTVAEYAGRFLDPAETAALNARRAEIVRAIRLRIKMAGEQNVLF